MSLDASSAAATEHSGLMMSKSSDDDGPNSLSVPAPGCPREPLGALTPDWMFKPGFAQKDSVPWAPVKHETESMFGLELKALAAAEVDKSDESVAEATEQRKEDICKELGDATNPLNKFYKIDEALDKSIADATQQQKYDISKELESPIEDASTDCPLSPA